MPELPEAERARQEIERTLGREIVAVDDADTYVCRPHAPGEIAAALTGRRLTAAHRRGKFMWVETDDGGPDLGLHLGMAGRIVVDEPESDRGWDRFALAFADGGRLAPRAARSATRSGAAAPTPASSTPSGFRAAAAHAAGASCCVPGSAGARRTGAPSTNRTIRVRHPEGVSPDAAISIRGAVKRFGPITAVDHLDLEVPPGVCFGLLGPNGAGKSTTMRLLTAQAIADAGDIHVLGFPLPEESKAARLAMGVVPQLDNLDVELTARENLAVFAWLYRVPRGERRDAVDRALRLARLTDRAHTPVNELSGGMRRRLLLARGPVHQPRLVLLDDPTVGLDPQVRQGLWSPT